MATAIRRARRVRALRATAAAVAATSFYLVVVLLHFIVETQPIAMLPLAVALTVLALTPWADTVGFALAVCAGVVAVALGCAALAVAL